MADVSATLAEYLASMRARRWQPGLLDCGVFMADWVWRLTGIDPIADVRGSYSTEREFRRIVRHEGGLMVSCGRRLASVGFTETDKPGAGDIAIVLAPYAKRGDRMQRRPTGAICVSAGMRAVITSDMGLVIAGDAGLPIARVWHG
jgi:hypothetical protein